MHAKLNLTSIKMNLFWAAICEVRYQEKASKNFASRAGGSWGSELDKLKNPGTIRRGERDH